MKWLWCFCALIFVPALFAAPLDHQLGFEYIYPPPNATEVSFAARLLFRLQEQSAEYLLTHAQIKIYDQSDKSIHGQWQKASDDRTLFFQPQFTFTAGDTIFVQITPQDAAALIHPIKYFFIVANNAQPTIYQSKENLAKPATRIGAAQIMPNGVSVPSDFPLVEIQQNTATSDGYLFLNNWGEGYCYNMILQNDGSPVWYQKYPDERRDMKVQKNGLLTMLVRQGYPFGQGFIALDEHDAVVDSFWAVDDCSTDEHELQVLENGNYLLFGLRTLHVDMSRYITGGNRNATVYESGIQEFTPQGELIFHWRAWDHFDPLDMIGYSPDDQPTDATFRFPHMNSLDIDDDGNIILSSKRLSEVTKINRQTGEIIWRLGGAHNQFQFVNDPLNGFFNQHSVRALGNGHYTIFDNGCLHSPPQSRAVEYKLDMQAMTATMVWSYAENPPVYAYHMGNVQRLPNGNTLINWAIADLPKAQEILPDGSQVFSMNFVDAYKTYRTFRFPWHGKALAPNLIVEAQSDHLVLLFNKFGDEQVAYYNIYADVAPHPTTVLQTSKQTLMRLYNLQNDRRYYFRVTAVDSTGHESAFSPEVSEFIHWLPSGGEQVQNGDFAAGLQNWDWLVRGSAQAERTVENGVMHVQINSGGDSDHDIQLTQAGIALQKGRTYIFEFDAWAAASRTAEIKIAQNGSPFTNYSGLGNSALSRVKKHFSYEFTMQDATDADARIVFNLGLYDVDVYVDNVSVKLADETAVAAPEKNVETFTLGNYPNPFNATTTIAYYLPQAGEVELQIVNLRGQAVTACVQAQQQPGEHQIVFNATELSSGIYFYQLFLDKRRIAQKKMVVVK